VAFFAAISAATLAGLVRLAARWRSLSGAQARQLAFYALVTVVSRVMNLLRIDAPDAAGHIYSAQTARYFVVLSAPAAFSAA
jgi:hypothetical protein